jgi:hypothetical protein
MAWTTQQITNLNNSMSAAQDVRLGDLLAGVVGITGSFAVASGAEVLTATPTIVTTGLNTISSVTVAMSGSPTAKHMWTTVVAGSTAGDIIISAWQPTNASTVTPIAATGSFVGITWIAVGT